MNTPSTPSASQTFQLIDYYAQPVVPDGEKCHILLDVETLSLKPNAAITEIAMVAPASNETFSLKINPAHYNDRFFSVDQGTVQWHNQRTGKDYIESLSEECLPGDAAFKTIQWMKGVSGGKPIALWTQGTDFDIPILRNLLQTYNLQLPLRHDSIRDFRTLAKLFPLIKYEKGNHSAFDDVLKMNIHLQKLFQFEIVRTQFIPSQEFQG